VADRTFLSPIELGGQLRAIDISPDGQTLAIADAQHFDPPSWGRIVLLDLNGFNRRNASFQVGGGETGAFGLAYDFNGNILISPALSTATSAPLRLYNASTGQVVRFGTSSGEVFVAGNTVVKANSGRAILGIAETASPDGAWGTYYASSGQLVRFRGPNGTAGGNYPSDRIVDFATDDVQAFLPTTGSMHIRNLNGAWVLRYGETGSPTYGSGVRRAPNYVAADATSGRLYFSDSNTPQVRIITSSTRAIQGFIDAETTFGDTSGAYGTGALRLANNNSSILIAVPGGVRYVPLQNGMPIPPAADGNSLTTPEDTPKSFTLPPPPPSPAYGGTPTYAITVNPTRGFLYGTAPNLTYVPYNNYNGADSFTYTVNDGFQTRTQLFSITVTPVNDAPIARNGSATVHSGKSTTVYPLSSTPIIRVSRAAEVNLHRALSPRPLAALWFP
jgi:hypothetical protein